MKKYTKRESIISWTIITLFALVLYILFHPSWFAIITGLAILGIISFNPKRPIKIISLSIIILADLIYIVFF